MKVMKISLAIFVVALVFFVSSSMFEKWKKSPQTVGMKIFANSGTVSAENGKIVLNDGKNSFSFVMKDSAWRVEECGEYFADYTMSSVLIYMLNSSRLYNTEQKEKFEPIWTISVFEKDNLLDRVEVSSPQENIYSAKKDGDSKIYAMSQMFDFPHSCDLWLKQPLIALQKDAVASVKVKDKLFEKDDDSQDFTANENDKKYLENMFLQLGNLRFITAERAQENKEDNLLETIEITTTQGLVIEIEILQNGEKYHIKMSTDTTVLPQNGIREYVENNKVLYDGWLFEITKNQAEQFIKP